MLAEIEFGASLLKQVLADVYALLPVSMREAKPLGVSLDAPVVVFSYKNEIEIKQDPLYFTNAVSAIYEVLLVIQQNNLLTGNWGSYLIWNPRKTLKLHGYFKSLDAICYRLNLHDAQGVLTTEEVVPVAEGRWDVRSFRVEHRVSSARVIESDASITLDWGGQNVVLKKTHSWLMHIVDEGTLHLGLALFQFLHQIKRVGFKSELLNILDGLYDLLHLRMQDYWLHVLADVLANLRSVDSAVMARDRLLEVLRHDEVVLSGVQSQLARVILLKEAENTFLEVRDMLVACFDVLRECKLLAEDGLVQVEPVQKIKEEKNNDEVDFEGKWVKKNKEEKITEEKSLPAGGLISLSPEFDGLDLVHIQEVVSVLTEYKDMLGDGITNHIFSSRFEGDFNYFVYIEDVLQNLKRSDVSPDLRFKALRGTSLYEGSYQAQVDTILRSIEVYLIELQKPAWFGLRTTLWQQKIDDAQALKKILLNENLPPKIRLFEFAKKLPEFIPHFDALRDSVVGAFLKRVCAVLLVTVGFALGVLPAIPAYKYAKDRFFRSRGGRFVDKVAIAEIDGIRIVNRGLSV